MTLYWADPLLGLLLPDAMGWYSARYVGTRSLSQRDARTGGSSSGSLKMRLFITGASGHLGSRVVMRLLRSPQIELFAIKRRTSSLARLANAGDRIRWYNADELPFAKILEECQPDIVLHAATQYGADSHGCATLVESNVAMPVQILDAAIAHNVKAFINVDTLLDGTVSAYALSKSQFREWLRACAGSIRAVDVAAELFFGPGGNPRNFVTSLVRQLMRGDARVPLTPGEQVRDFIAIDDLVEAVECVLRHVSRAQGVPGYERFEVGGGSPRTIREFAMSVQGIVGNTAQALDFGAVPYRPNEPMRLVPDLTRIRGIGWMPNSSFRETIISMAEEERAHLC